MSLSVCIITLNEEANIGRTLKSVKDIADEIILENQVRRRQTGPIELKHRDNTAVEESPGLQNTPVAAPPVAKPPIQQPPK